jgi:nuclear pore complex protein Nup133
MYFKNEDMGATNPTKLLVLRKSLAVVQSGDRILLISLNGKYNSVLPLKSPLDRFLAVAQASTNSPTTEQLIAMTASGMLEITVDVVRAVQGNIRLASILVVASLLNRMIGNRRSASSRRS